MINPVVIVGGAALALWLILRGKKEEPAPEPIPQPPVKTTTPPKVDEAGKVYKPADEGQKWRDMGYAVGYAHGSAGQPYNQVSAEAPEQYQAYYAEGYRQGFNQGTVDFASGTMGTKPTSSWGAPQGSKSAGNSGPVIDYSTGRVTGIHDTRIARPRRW